MKFLKTIEDYIYGFVGSWAYFVGTCVADGFDDRMNAIQEEESNPLADSGEQDPFEVKAASKPEGNHGAN